MSREDHPVFQDGATRVALVQRVDVPDGFGVAVRDAKFIYALPQGYDGRTSVNFLDGYVLVAHPLHPPLIIDPLTGKVREVDASLVPKRVPILRPH